MSSDPGHPLGPSRRRPAPGGAGSGRSCQRNGGGRPPLPPSSEPLHTEALGIELVRFGAALRAAGLRASTIHAYLLGASLFVRWLAGDYVPRGRAR